MKLAVLVKNLSPSQLAVRFLTQANELVGSRTDTDILALYEELRRPCILPNFAAMQIAEGWGFDGATVATSASTAEKLLGFPSSTKKLFYVWDLEWIRRPGQFRHWQATYGNPNLTLIARSLDHKKVISQAWNRDVLLIEDFDLTKIIEVTRSEGLAI